MSSDSESVRHCDRCDRPLEAQHEGCEHFCLWHRNISPGQWDNALIINFEGGYGMFVDPAVSADRIEAVLCHECAHQLVQEPWVRKAIGDPLLSHSHRPGSVSEEHLHEQHEAWNAAAARHAARAAADD